MLFSPLNLSQRPDWTATWRLLQAALISVVFLCGASLKAHAQFTRFQNYTDEQGLGNLTVTALAQSKDGYILVGTQSGLFRYDGTSFRHDVSGLPSDWIKQLVADPAGRVWVVTNDNGLFVGDGVSFHEVDIGRGAITIMASHVFAIASDNAVLDVDGSLVQVAATTGVSSRPVPLFDRPTLATAPGLTRARFVVPDVAGGLLIGCGDALCRAADGRVTLYDTMTGLPADSWRTALWTPDGTVWVRSLDRLAWRRPRETAFTSIDVPGRHRSYFAGAPDDLQLLPDKAGGVLTPGDEGLLDWTGSTWRVLAPHTGGLPPAAVTAMLLDREGSLWIGSFGYGAFRSAGLGIWEHWTKEDGLPSSTVWGHARLPDGRFWVSTEAGSVVLGGGKDGIGGQNFAAAVSRAGRVWLAPTTGPLTRVGNSGGAPVHLPSIGNVYGAAIDHEDRLWLTTEESLFEVPDADAAPPDLRVQRALSGRWCHVVQDPAATDWAVCRRGLFRRDPYGTFEQATLPAAVETQSFEDAGFTANGELWLGTEASGVLRLRVVSGRLELLSAVGLPATGTDSVMFIYRDRRNSMWVGTSHGIDRFDGRSWQRFDSSDGPISNDMDEYSVSEDADGSMWFGTSHGLSHFIDPDHLPPQLPLHPLITSVSRGSETLPLRPAIRIAWSQEPLVIRFNDLDYARGRGLVFRYRLEGVDTSWNDTAAREVRYGQLPAGKLHFELIAVDTVHNTVSGETGFTIWIDPPWWRRRWFEGLCTLFGGGLAVAAWRFRVRLLLLRQRRLEDEQGRLEEVVSARTAEIEHAKNQLQHQAAELKRQAVDLQRLAMSDTLTGLPNRRAIMDALESGISEARLLGPALAVMICDIDHFKSINDTFGHLGGDAVLTAFGTRLKAALALSEAGGRYGGKEFLVILRGEPVGIRGRVAAIQSVLVDAPFRVDQVDRTVTCSGGLAFLKADDALFSLLARADTALYRAKANGRNRVEEERNETTGSLTGRREDPALLLKRDLRTALARGECTLHYQPVLDVECNRVTSYEALLRWHSPSRGDVPPASFIPFAEQNDLMMEIDDWVLRTACREATSWPDDIRISVNLSPSYFHQADLVSNIAAAIASSGLAAGRLELELTETAMIVDVEAATQVLKQLRGLGISIALDDFGTGYSSLSFLRTLPFDRIKIDRSFVRDLGSRPEAAAIIGSVIHLCRGLSTAVTAEGVETPKQIEMLRAIGCREMQGFEIGRPMPADRIRAERHVALALRTKVRTSAS